LGAFIYSEEEGTYSHKNYKDDVEPDIKNRRLDELMVVQEQVAQEIGEKKLGQTLKVIIDREEPDYYIGRTEYDSPEVDPEVLVDKTQPLILGNFYQVKIMGSQVFDLFGNIDNNYYKKP